MPKTLIKTLNKNIKTQGRWGMVTAMPGILSNKFELKNETLKNSNVENPQMSGVLV